MRLSFNKYLAITVTLLCFSNVSLAGEVVCDANTSYDYGDATGYSEACHATNNWQQLGDNPQQLSGDNRAANNDDSWTSETTQNSVDVGDDGVSWRVQNPADLSWSAFGNEPLTAGANVEFQFVVTRSNQGNHEFDQLKAWGDWNDNGVFDDSEEIVDQKWYKVADSFAAGNVAGDANLYGDSGWNNDPLVNADFGSIRNSGVTSEILIVSTQIPVDAVISDTWIRARIICENSLTHTDRNNNVFLATGYYHQGEVEDYKVAVTSVPEPTTLFVFGSALIGLVLSRKKSK
jgi:hypothetical protein